MISMIEGEVSIRVGRVRIEVEASPDATYHRGHVEELRRAIVQACLAMDTDESRALATKVEGAQS